MASIDVINAIVDGVIATIDENRALLGNPLIIYEKLEDPAILAEDYVLPVIHVLPLAEGSDNMTGAMCGFGHHHDFAITIIGTYDTEGVNEELRVIREYGYACSDLFKGVNSKVGEGNVYKIELRFGAMTIIDHVLQQFVMTLSLKTWD
jgi:hypothetical protein